MVNILQIMWLLFMTISIVTVCFMAYTEIKTDYKILRDSKDLKSLRKMVREQSEMIDNRERRIFELEQENSNLWSEKTELSIALKLNKGESTKEVYERAKSKLDEMIDVDGIQKSGE